MRYYDNYAVCHVKLSDQAVLPSVLPSVRPTFEELEQRRFLLDGARSGNGRQLDCLVALARTYHLTLPLVMDRLPDKRRRVVAAALTAP
jgi:hypothetical protein